MGFFTRFFGAPYDPAPEETGSVKGPGTFRVPIVGESHYQDALEAICGGRQSGGVDVQAEAFLILEDSDPHAPKAVRVDINTWTVGYLSRENARQYRQRLADAGHPRLRGHCHARICGGWDHGPSDRGSFGVWLDLPADED